MESNEFIKKISVAFLERKPQFIETDNPYTAAKFYKDLSDSDFAVHVAQNVRSGGRGDDGTVALLSNVAGAIMTVHGDSVRS